MTSPQAVEIVEFWFGKVTNPNQVIPQDKVKKWYRGGKAFDDLIRNKYETTMQQALEQKLPSFEAWKKDPIGCLALILMADQFSRNIYRGTKKSFKYDKYSQEICLSGIKLGIDIKLLNIHPRYTYFMYHSLLHAEDLTLQKLFQKKQNEIYNLLDNSNSIHKKHFKGSGTKYLQYMIDFGRFPHRNDILGRISTPEELEAIKKMKYNPVKNKNDNKKQQQTTDNDIKQPDNDPNDDNDQKQHSNKMKDIFGKLQKFDQNKLKATQTVVRHIVGIVDRATGAGPDSAINDDEIKEYYDDVDVLKEKAKKFAKLLKKSKYTVVHTGAGVSTAAKLPDYRGPQGVWTLRSKGYEPQFQITLEQAKPTYTHMALAKLKEKGKLKYLVSTNVDGLHRRSGFSADEMAELHGNGYKEYCNECGQEYIRAFDVTLKRKGRFTGRLCQKNNCDGKLRDSIINFGENLPVKELQNAQLHTAKADLCVMLGSSMRVTPAADIPSLCYGRNDKPGIFIIVNLQKTNYDDFCASSGGFRVGAKIDDFFKLVMGILKIKVDPFTDDKMLASISDDMKKIKVDPNFTLYNIIKKK